MSERAPDYQGDPLDDAGCVFSLSLHAAATATQEAMADEKPAQGCIPRALWADSRESALVPSADSHESAHQGAGGAASTSATADTPNQPGNIHSTHYMLQVDQYVFCGVCGVYAKQIRRSQLHVPCPRAPKNRFARVARDKLLEGKEPEGRGWRCTQAVVKPLAAD